MSEVIYFEPNFTKFWELDEIIAEISSSRFTELKILQFDISEGDAEVAFMVLKYCYHHSIPAKIICVNKIIRIKVGED